MNAKRSPMCVYCGSAWGKNPEYRAAAVRLGRAMGRRKIDLVYGGGRLGLMREVADAVLSEGGHVLGVITHDLKHKEVAHEGVSRMVVVNTMHERKKIMADTARGFIALPGGVGTLDELFEILAWAQLGIHAHPVGLLNAAGFYDALMRFLERVASEGFLRIDAEKMLIVDGDEERLLDRMGEHEELKRAGYETAPRYTRSEREG